MYFILYTLLGDPLSRHFIRVVQHDPPASLEELQAELRAETLEGEADYRAGPQILAQSLAESGLEGETFVRASGGREVPLVEGGAEVPVTNENKAEWLQRLLRSELVDSLAPAAAHFRRGLLQVVGLRDADPDCAEVDSIGI